MTLLVVVLLGTASLFIISSIENQSLQTVISTILAGDTLTKAPEPALGVAEPVAPPSEPAPPTGETKWYDYPIVQKYGQALTGVINTGLDLAVPFHTKVTSLTAGQVVQASYSPQIGGQVVVQFQSAGRTLYAAYVHLDTIAVSLGQRISIGTNLGLSGGQLSGGAHPAQEPYSTGPHTLFGLFTANVTDYAHSVDPSAFFNTIVNYLRGVGVTA